jgi:hypothetical protein
VCEERRDKGGVRVNVTRQGKKARNVGLDASMRNKKRAICKKKKKKRALTLTERCTAPQRKHHSFETKRAPRRRKLLTTAGDPRPLNPNLNHLRSMDRCWSGGGACTVLRSRHCRSAHRRPISATPVISKQGSAHCAMTQKDDAVTKRTSMNVENVVI